VAQAAALSATQEHEAARAILAQILQRDGCNVPAMKVRGSAPVAPTT
jgi:hypothetical protein